MKKTQSDARRDRANTSILGTTQIHLRNPYIITWWSAAFPGFGHVLMSKYIRGLLLFVWEVVINIKAKLNLAMIYSFTGHFHMAKEILNTRWILLYISVYLFAIWDSYRTTVDLNKIYLLADHEKSTIVNFNIKALEINYLDKREPWVAVVWSALMPGLGQLYIHRVVASFFVLIWWILFNYFSHFLEAVTFILLGELAKATDAVDGQRAQWLLFMPSVYGFAIYDAYVNTVENNKLFKYEQRDFLRKTYQHRSFVMPKSR